MPDAAAAKITLAAQTVRIDARPIADSDPRDARTDRRDLTGKLMSEHCPRRRFGSALVAAENVCIRAANAAGAHPQQHLSRPADGLLPLLDAQIPRFALMLLILSFHTELPSGLYNNTPA